ncbi:hypothetical protein LDENG_00085970 [Lucifuga dentata]|nr:hypothetical protein LDENG_00085970 [Lucifuga dentata]
MSDLPEQRSPPPPHDSLAPPRRPDHIYQLLRIVYQNIWLFTFSTAEGDTNNTAKQSALCFANWATGHRLDASQRIKNNTQQACPLKVWCHWSASPRENSPRRASCWTA